MYADGGAAAVGATTLEVVAVAKRLIHGLVAVGFLSLSFAGKVRGQSAGYAIAGIEAKLFYSNGEGTVEGPSENTLLLVKINGPFRGEPEDLRLRITATTEADTLPTRISTLVP